MDAPRRRLILVLRRVSRTLGRRRNHGAGTKVQPPCSQINVVPNGACMSNPAQRRLFSRGIGDWWRHALAEDVPIGRTGCLDRRLVRQLHEVLEFTDRRLQLADLSIDLRTPVIQGRAYRLDVLLERHQFVELDGAGLEIGAHPRELLQDLLGDVVVHFIEQVIGVSSI